MKTTVSHEWAEETIEAKVHWFCSLPIAERMELLCAFTDLALELNPDLPDQKDAQQAHRNIRILSRA